MIMYSIHLLSFLVIVSFRLASATATLAVQYPIKDQLPLIARVGQNYSWTISKQTFSNANANLTASGLPSWLSFNASTGTLSGTPSQDDEGSDAILLSSGDGSLHDEFTLCVTRFPPPVQRIALAQQFNASNPSFSSVFVTPTNDSSVPPLARVPLHWSFSVGLEGDMYQPAVSNGSAGELVYYALQADGTPLPSWISFNTESVTFDGVARSPLTFEGDRLRIALIASDQPGYSAYHDVFDLLVASHEVSLIQQQGAQAVLPINVTEGEGIVFDFKEEIWVLGGVRVDNSSVVSDNITSLTVDTTNVPWLSYDANSTTLHGSAPASKSDAVQSFALPMVLTVANQTLALNTTLNIVPSYFTQSSLQQVYVAPGSDVNFSLSQFISKVDLFSGHDVSLNVTYDPASTSSFLNFNVSSQLTGTVPRDVPVSHTNVTFSAYDHTSHTASRTTLLLTYRLGSHDNTSPRSPNQQAALARRRRLALGLGLGFGGFLALVILFGCIAAVRKWCRVKEEVVGIDAYGRRSDEYDEKTKYLVGDEEEVGYGWTEKLGLGLEASQATEMNGGIAHSVSPPYRSPYPGVGIGYSPHTRNTNMVPKAAFFHGIKTIMRKISDGPAFIADSIAQRTLRNKSPSGVCVAGGTGNSKSKSKKTAISKPILMFTKDSAESLKRLQEAAGLNLGSDDPGSGLGIGGTDALSIGMGSSPTSSTGDTDGSASSVPRQRPDFGPPRAPASALTNSKLRGARPAPPTKPKTAKVSDRLQNVLHQHGHARRRSSDTQHTQSSGDIEEAVIVTASRAPSVRSAHSRYSYSRDSSAAVPVSVSVPIPAVPATTRPRLVQFTSARGVPTPASGSPTLGVPSGDKSRRVSQVAAVVLNDAAHSGSGAAREEPDTIMTEGMRYVRAFGDVEREREPAFPPNLGYATSQSRRSSASGMTGIHDRGKLSPAPTSSSSPVPTTHSTMTSSYIYPSPSASFDSELNSRGSLVMRRILVRTDEAFAFRFPVAALPSTSSDASKIPKNKEKELIVKLLYGGGPLPRFLEHVIVAPSPSSSKKSTVGKKNASGGDGAMDVEFWGTPGAKDVGEVFVGVFDTRAGQNLCVGKLVVEVVGGR